MLRIANPMYDAVFKHLLEDDAAARLIVGTILGEEIDELEMLPQESFVCVALLPDSQGEGDFTLSRVDFAATIRTAAGERMRVLIEVQKGESRFSDGIMRFRRYLTPNCADGRAYVTVRERGAERRRALPLLTIYFLAGLRPSKANRKRFAHGRPTARELQPDCKPKPRSRRLGRRLPDTEATVLKVVRRYVDAVTGAELPAREDFVEALTHDCYVVQVPRLPEHRRNDLEKLLAIFDQSLRTEDRHVLELDDAGIPDAYAPVLRRLQAAAADQAVAVSMALEDEIVGEWTRMQRDIAARDDVIAEKDDVIAEKDEAIAEKDEALRRQQAEIDALRRQLGPR